jgi:hypothetical protein
VAPRSRSTHMLVLAFLVAGLGPHVAFGADPLALTLSGHRFSPDQIMVPAGKRVSLRVTNADPTPAEFESSALRVEKVVPAGKTITVNIGPLNPGTYKFIDDFHRETATGTVTAVADKN